MILRKYSLLTFLFIFMLSNIYLFYFHGLVHLLASFEIKGFSSFSIFIDLSISMLFVSIFHVVVPCGISIDY